MGKLPFNQGILEWIVDHRFEPLTSIFLFFTFLGGEFGYILIVLAMYWLYNKKFAIRLSIVIITSSLLNHLLKITIKNPRPFVSNGTYNDNWAISKGSMEDTVMEYSTPSGHAMGSASFWSYFHKKFNSRNSLILAVIMILMIGLSRPYLGVHYFEDIILGWILGLLVTYSILRYEDRVSSVWKSLSLLLRNSLIVVIAISAWVLAGFLGDWNFDASNIATFAGLITGLLVGASLEANYIGFTTRSSSRLIAVIKVIIGFAVTIGVFLSLDVLFTKLSGDFSFLGFLLRYIRYSSLGIVATLVVGWIFIKLGLSEKNINTS